MAVYITGCKYTKCFRKKQAILDFSATFRGKNCANSIKTSVCADYLNKKEGQAWSFTA